MQKDLKFKIISEASEHGVSKTCQKYGISRTIYYKWLKRYQALGLGGLEDTKRNFIPENKTDPEIEQAVLNMIKTYPTYGPRAIKYLLEELDHEIGESAVFNIMKRNNLTNKEKRLRYARKKEATSHSLSIPIDIVQSGECWLFWITECGYFPEHGHVYTYTFMDAKSRITCSRLYRSLSYENFEDLLTEVALPIAQSLNMNPKFLSIFDDSNIISASSKTLLPSFHKALHDRGFEMNIHMITVDHTMPEFLSLRTEHTKGCIAAILPLLQSQAPFEMIKTELQHYIRFFNLELKFTHGDIARSPVEYHHQHTHEKPILPIWAYMDRPY